MTILDAMADQNLLAPLFQPSSSWAPWRAALAAIHGLPMTAEHLLTFQRHTGRQHAPTTPAREVWLVCGRRSGKSRLGAALAVYAAAFRSYNAILSAGGDAAMAPASSRAEFGQSAEKAPVGPRVRGADGARNPVGAGVAGRVSEGYFGQERADRGKRMTEPVAYTFKIGELFPANDITSRWMIALLMSFNDAIFVAEKLAAALGDEHAPFHEKLYYVRLIGSHLWEIALFLRDSRDIEGVEKLIGDLPGEVRRDYDHVAGLVDTADGFKADLARLRNSFFHYARTDWKELPASLKAVKDLDSEVRIEGRIGDLHAAVADHVASQMMFPTLRRTDEEFLKFNTRIRDANGALIRCVPVLLQAYVAARLPAAT